MTIHRLRHRRRGLAHSAWLAVVLSLSAVRSIGAAEPPFRVPDGFRVTTFADDDWATNIYALTFSPRGEVVVAGPGYIKILHDDDRDGVADRQTLFTDRVPHGVQGMEFDGNHLLCSAGPGVLYFRDEDGDGRADGEPEVWVRFDRTQGGEHSAHAIRKGPDGWFYMIVGNDTGLSSRHAGTPFSPVKWPVQGALLAIDPQGGATEVLADGFRNPYDFDFDKHGRIFTYDSDGERDWHLPWYAPTRAFDIALGRHHGWLFPGWQRSWSRPEYFFDTVDWVAETGRGSPTGVVCYRHRQFPPRYRDGLFLACWTYGRIYFLPLQPDGSTVRSAPEIFLQSIGSDGFAPVDMEVSPQGDLYVAIGGRGTRGGVYRIRYEAGVAAGWNERPDDLRRVLQADQPLSAWSRAQWLPMADRLGAEAFQRAASSDRFSADERIRAIEILVERFEGLPIPLAREIVRSADAGVVAAVARSMARRQDDVEVEILLAELTYDDDPQVQRTAWEALLHRRAFFADDRIAPAWESAAAAADRRVRAAMIEVARGPGASDYRRRRQTVAEPRGVLTSLWIDGFDPQRSEPYVGACLEAFRSDDPDLRLEAVRLLQIALGDIHADGQHALSVPGYLAREPNNLTADQKAAIARRLNAALPTADADLEREIARLLAMLRARGPSVTENIIARIEPDSHPTEDAHYLMVLAQLPDVRTPEVTARTADALVGLDGKMRALDLAPSRNWPLRISETFGQLQRWDPTLAEAVIEHPEFGLPEHALYAAPLAAGLRSRAARRMLARSELEDDEYWTVDLVHLVAELPASESLPVLRDLWYDRSLRPAIVPALARHRDPADRKRLVEALAAEQIDTAQTAAEALLPLPGEATPEEIAAALRALRRFCADRRFAAQRELLRRLLTRWSGQELPIAENAEDPWLAHAPWFDWFEQTHPEAAAELSGFGAVGAVWQERLAALDWDQGDSSRGEAFFANASCARCHTGRARTGPELTNITQRLSREDLFTKIIDPHRDVSPLYQSTILITADGRIYQGQIIYESVAATLLRTGLNETVRIAGPRIVSMHPSSQSPMPSGLLDDATDRDLADLYAYLMTLTQE